MFLNTTLYLVGHETVKRQGNKNGRNLAVYSCQEEKLLEANERCSENRILTSLSLFLITCQLELY